MRTHTHIHTYTHSHTQELEEQFKVEMEKIMKIFTGVFLCKRGSEKEVEYVKYIISGCMQGTSRMYSTYSTRERSRQRGEGRGGKVGGEGGGETSISTS